MGQRMGGLGLCELAFVAIAIVLLITSWFGLLLAELGVFSIYALAIGVVVLVAILYLLLSRTPFKSVAQDHSLASSRTDSAPGQYNYEPDGGEQSVRTGQARLDPRGEASLGRLAPRNRVEAIGLLVLIGVAGVLYGQPFEYILGGLDSGAYVNAGVRMAREGSVFIQDVATVGFTPEQRELLFGLPPKPWVAGNRFPGFYLMDLEAGTVESHGFHLYPVWIAILYSLGGLQLGLYATPLFGLLGVLALYFLGKRLFGSAVGWLAAFFLSISVAQVWFSRFPMAETLVQFLLLTGLYAFAMMIEYDSRFFALLAGASFGLVHLTKIEVLLLPASLGLFLLVEVVRGHFRSHYFYFAAVYLLLLVQAIVHAVTASRAYTFDVFQGTVFTFLNLLVKGTYTLQAKIPGGGVALAVVVFLGAIVVVGGAGLLVVLVRRSSLEGTTTRTCAKALPFAFVLLVGIAALYGYFVRPNVLPGGIASSTAERAYEINNSSSLVRLAWYISPLGLLLGLAGLFRAVLRDLDRRLIIVLLVSLPITFLYLFQNFVAPLHFWAGRRFVYAVIPLFFLLAAHALVSLRKSSGFSLRDDVIPVALGVALVLSLIPPNLPFLGHVEFNGAERELSHLTGKLPRDGVVLFESSLAANRFATPLQYLFDRDVFLFPRESLADARFPSLLRKWREERRSIYWAAVTDDAASLPQGYALNYISTETLVLPVAELTEDRLPQRVESYVTVVDMYEFVPAELGREQVTVEIDLADESRFISGVYGADEVQDSSRIRWTTGNARIRLPKWDFQRSAELLLKVASNRPGYLAVAKMNVLIDGQLLLGEQLLTRDFRVYRISIPENTVRGDSPELQLLSDTFNPRALGISQDARNLGLLLNSIKIRQ